jgi:uncharacterized protein (TIGR03084 family)
MDDALVGLAAQHAELTALLDDLSGAGWSRPTRCDGWDVKDVVLHLAQTDEMAVASVTGSFDEVAEGLTADMATASSVDEGAAAMVARQRSTSSGAVAQRWKKASAHLDRSLAAIDLSTRVPWVAGELSARTLAATRLSETWIHTGDIAGAVGIDVAPSDRLRLIARLAWRTLPYAFQLHGRELGGPVALRLVAPSGELWEFLPDHPATTTIEGSAVEFCAVAAQRVEPEATTLVGEGPDATDVLAFVRTYA